MATEKEVFEMARQGVQQAAAPLMGMMSDRVAMKAQELDRQRKLADDQRRRDEARQDWIERFNMQTAAAKAAAKASQGFTRSERIARTEAAKEAAEATRNFQATESDWNFYRNRMVQLNERGFAIQQDEKEMRLKAAQYGMVNANEASIEEVYKHIYDNAPEELEKFKKRQRDAFTALNPEIHQNYENLSEQRNGIYGQIGELIRNTSVPEQDEILKSLLPKLIADPTFKLNDTDIERIQTEGLGAVAELIQGDAAAETKLGTLMEQVSEEVGDAKAKKVSNQISLLMEKARVIDSNMKRIETVNPTIGLESTTVINDRTSRNFLNNRNQDAVQTGKFNLPPQGGATPARTRVNLSDAEEKEFQNFWNNNPNVQAWKKNLGNPNKSPDDKADKYDYRAAWKGGDVPRLEQVDGRYHWGTGPSNAPWKDLDHPTFPFPTTPSDADSPAAGGFGPATPSTPPLDMSRFGPLSDDTDALEKERATLEGNVQRQNDMMSKAIKRGNRPNDTVVKSLAENEQRISDIENMIFRLNQDNISPVPLEGGDPGFRGVVSGNPRPQETAEERSIRVRRLLNKGVNRTREELRRSPFYGGGQ
jgi:hypothetical protein